MRPRLGVNFWNPRRGMGQSVPYPRGMYFIEPVYTNPRDMVAPRHHWRDVGNTVRTLRENGHVPVLVVKYREGEDFPITEEAKREFMYGVTQLAQRSEFHGMKVSAFNEPNLENVPAPHVAALFNGFDTDPHDTGNFVQTWRTFDIEAQFYSPAVAPYNPDGDIGIGVDPISGGENSPWDNYNRALQLYLGLAEQSSWARRLNGYLIHAYARDVETRGPTEPWQDVRDQHGWRWGSNVAETLIAGHMHTRPTIVSEFNSRLDNPGSVSYRPGLLLNAWSYFISVIPHLEAVCFFVDHSPSEEWNADALGSGMGHMIQAETDFEHLLRAQL